jgi:hypothetical protein
VCYKKTKTKYPISYYVSYDGISNRHKHICLAISADEEQTNFKEAIQQPCWQKGIEAELEALERNKLGIDKPSSSEKYSDLQMDLQD